MDETTDWRSTIVTWMGAFCDELFDDLKVSRIGVREDEAPWASGLDSTWSAMTWLDVGTGWTFEGSAVAGSVGRDAGWVGCCGAFEGAGFVTGDTPDAANSSSRFFTAAFMEALWPTFSRQVKYILKASADCNSGELGS